jgi:hypothetical protein
MQPHILRSTSPPSAGSKSKPGKKPAQVGDKVTETPASAVSCLVYSLILKMRSYVSPERRDVSQLEGSATQENISS